ncbi:phosphoserine aminotransferase isoform X2 [Schistocerca nitens]|uniref:phosphoserine aminotransferase isoform X2 n=1 Tax=Schistocerca nitens TaxID=7011 RepID=UPI0021185AC6|nr:phosphoserine aminotransferase isoform X2 [Schistocerca nitens]
MEDILNSCNLNLRAVRLAARPLAQLSAGGATLQQLASTHLQLTSGRRTGEQCSHWQCERRRNSSRDMATAKKVFNFGAGPAKLPREILLQAQRELLDYDNTGMSIMEMSHRSAKYTELNNRVQQDMRDLLKVPDNYKILFLQGGATGIFSAVPMNLMPAGGNADYIVTGSWSSKAAKEAAKYGKVNMVLPKMDAYNDIPNQSTWKLSPDASYVYYCANETIHGVEFRYIPDTKGVPLVCDMSSNFLSEEFDVSKFGVIFACAQKNVGTSGVTVVIIREDLIGKAQPIVPTILDFKINAQDNSVHNTPPMYPIYIMGLYLQWIKKQGGAAAMGQQAQQKSRRVYEVVNSSAGFYSLPVAEHCRSRMNVPFRIAGGDAALEKKFLEGAEERGMQQLKGHRSVGGIRASLYNAITMDEVEALIKYMTDFQKEHAKK